MKMAMTKDTSTDAEAIAVLIAEIAVANARLGAYDMTDHANPATMAAIDQAIADITTDQRT